MALYEVLIKGGQVFDPARDVRGVYDVAISQGKIAAIERDIAPTQAQRVIMAQGLLVVPGLVDLHTHLGFELHTKVVQANDVCPQAGVTTAVDMGSVGAFTFPWYREQAIKKTAIRLRSFLNIASLGTIAIHTPYYVERYGQYVDLADTLRTIEENREHIRGIKVFTSGAMVGQWAHHALGAARQVADRVGLPIAVHISMQPPPLAEVLAYLGPGDIVTHTYTPHDQGILDEAGRVRPCVWEARRRGVLFDLGHGAGSFAFDVARKAMAQDFLPDSLSTDLYYANVEKPVKDFPTTISKFLNLGLPLEDALARATCNPARALGEPTLGTLAPGSPADIALFTLREGAFSFVDCLGQTLEGPWQLTCELTLYGGQIIYAKGA